MAGDERSGSRGGCADAGYVRASALPCTRASLGELERLAAQNPGKLRMIVFFFKPRGVTDDWAKTDTWRAAQSIPGVLVRTDEAGEQAQLFGVATSGDVVFYNAAGELQFHGGITAGRGHAGDNAGGRALLSLLEKQTPALVKTPVFGCSLRGAPQPGAEPVKLCQAAR